MKKLIEEIMMGYLHISVDNTEKLSMNSKAHYLNEKGIEFTKDRDYVGALKCFLDADRELPNNDAIQNNLQLCFAVLDEINKGFWQVMGN